MRVQIPSLALNLTPGHNLEMIKVQTSKHSDGPWITHIETSGSIVFISLSGLPAESAHMRITEDEGRYMKVDEASDINTHPQRQLTRRGGIN